MNPDAMTKTVRLYEGSKASGICRGCGAAMDWYDTLSGKKLPMNAGAVPLKSENERDTSRVVAWFDAADSHWNTCPTREQFRKKAKT